MLSFALNWAITQAELPVQQKLLGAALHELPYGLLDSKLGFGSSPQSALPPEGNGSQLNFYG